MAALARKTSSAPAGDRTAAGALPAIDRASFLRRRGVAVCRDQPPDGNPHSQHRPDPRALFGETEGVPEEYRIFLIGTVFFSSGGHTHQSAGLPIGQWLTVSLSQLESHMKCPPLHHLF